MPTTIDEFYEIVKSDVKLAKKFRKALEACFKRKLVLIIDEQCNTTITVFATYRGNARVTR